MSTIQTLAVKGLKNFFSLKPKRNPSITSDRAKLGLLFIYLTQLSDFTSTVIGLSVGAAEQNPLMANTIAFGGYPGFFLFKVVLAGTFLGWFTWKRKYAPWVIGSLYAAITIWNSVIIFIATR
jgi:hypothetical protein